MIDEKEYRARREHVLDALDGGVMILAQGKEQRYSNDTHYRFRHDSDLYYLTGFSEPEAVLVLRADGDAPYTLFVRPKDPVKEVWEGYREGPEGACRNYGADAAFDLSELPGRLGDLLDGAEALYYRLWDRSPVDASLSRALAALRGRERFGKRAPDVIIDPARILHAMRRVKSAAEIEVMAEAAAISARAHRAAMGICRPGLHEYHLQAEIERIFLASGAAGPGYPTIVGSGANGCVLHYIENRGVIGEDDLVLVDAGCEYQGYNGDITRTFPASGRFSAEQRALYEVVLETEESGIAMARPGVSIDEIHEHSLASLTRGLIDLGLLSMSLDEALEQKSYERFYMHRTSHWLGADVHDVGRYRASGTSVKLEPGMVFTVEPGLYISPNDETVPEGFRGQAIRIEDDVVVTETGVRILTRDVPVSVEELESLVGSVS